MRANATFKRTRICCPTGFAIRIFPALQTHSRPSIPKG